VQASIQKPESSVSHGDLELIIVVLVLIAALTLF
jgi:hypothetical protein